MLDKKNALCTLVTILIGINYSKNVHPLVSYLRTAIRNNPRTNSRQGQHGQLVQPELLLPGHEKKQPGVKKCFSERRSGSGEILRGISIRSEMSLGTGDLGDEDKQTTTLIPPSPAPQLRSIDSFSNRGFSFYRNPLPPKHCQVEPESRAERIGPCQQRISSLRRRYLAENNTRRCSVFGATAVRLYTLPHRPTSGTSVFAVDKADAGPERDFDRS